MIKNNTIKAGVIGHPIKHSKSPLIHNYWIKQAGLDASYTAIDIAPENLEKDVNALFDQGYVGFNVTIPHKETIMMCCDEIDENAKRCGAVNTVALKNGKRIGLNTDSFGFLHNIKQSEPEFDFTKGPAVVIGAGGAARAIINGLVNEGAPQILITNRTRERAEKIAKNYNDVTEVMDWDERHLPLKETNLLVNTTSLGMEGQPALDLNLESLNPSALVNDIVYAPLQTPLLKAAMQQGNKTVTGIGMLLHQARPAFEAWFSIMPEVDKHLEELVLKH